MPRKKEPMKDVIGDESVGKLPNKLWSSGVRMGKPSVMKITLSRLGGKGTWGTEISYVPRGKENEYDSVSKRRAKAE